MFVSKSRKVPEQEASGSPPSLCQPPLLALASQSTPTHIFEDIPAGKEEKLSSQISVEYV